MTPTQHLASINGHIAAALGLAAPEPPERETLASLPDPETLLKETHDAGWTLDHKWKVVDGWGVAITHGSLITETSIMCVHGRGKTVREALEAAVLKLESLLS